MKEILKRLSLAFGPSGCEDAVKEAIKKEIDAFLPKAKDVTEDQMGNLIIHIGCNKHL